MMSTGLVRCEYGVRKVWNSGLDELPEELEPVHDELRAGTV